MGSYVETGIVIAIVAVAAVWFGRKMWKQSKDGGCNCGTCGKGCASRFADKTPRGGSGNVCAES